jgi:hypothetical protein
MIKSQQVTLQSQKSYSKEYLVSQKMVSLVWWYTFVIPATWEAEIGGPRFKASLDKSVDSI